MSKCLKHGLNFQDNCVLCGGHWEVVEDVTPWQTEFDFVGAEEPPQPWNTQEGGNHYKTLAIQPFEYSMKNKLDPLQHTIIKYVTRFRDKNGIEDLKKAIHCLELLIDYEQVSK